MMYPYYLKSKQERATLIDTLNNQEELIKLVRGKKMKNSCLSFQEQEHFMLRFYYSVLSCGREKIQITLPNGEIQPYPTLGEFANFICMLDKEEVDIGNQKVIISYLWEQLEKLLVHFFSFAVNDSLYISKETPSRDKPGSFTFGTGFGKGGDKDE